MLKTHSFRCVSKLPNSSSEIYKAIQCTDIEKKATELDLDDIEECLVHFLAVYTKVEELRSMRMDKFTAPDTIFIPGK